MLRKRKLDETNENHFWISISDLMTSLLFIFILILVYMILDYQDKQNIVQNQITELQEQQKVVQKKILAFKENINARSDLLEEIQQSLKSNKVFVEIDKDDGTMRITRERLFHSSKADIIKNKKWIINSISETLISLMENHRYKKAINTIFIEGHTDDVPLDRGKCGFSWTNMELSSQRAINTFILMDQFTDSKLSELRNLSGQALISYSGYSDTRPIKGVSNDSVDGRERNRRIQFFFAVNPPNLEDIEK